MEREEIDALLADEAVASVLAERFVAKSDFDKVNSKKEQVLGEKKREQDKAKKLEEELSKWRSVSEQIGQLGYDVDEVLPTIVSKLQKQHDGVDEVDAPPKQTDESRKILEDRLTVQKQTYESKIESLKKDYDKKIADMEATTRQVITGWDAEKIENALMTEMNRVGVMPSHLKTLKLAFRNLAEVSENEDGVRGVLVTNDNGLKISVSEFFDAFAQSDEGKAYIAAPTTSGGSAIGGKGGRHTIDFNAERNKALQKGDSKSSIELAMAQYRQSQKKR